MAGPTRGGRALNRRDAVAGACLAVAVIVGAEIVAGEIRLWHAVAAGLAVLLAVALSRRARQTNPAQSASFAADGSASVAAILSKIPDPIILLDDRAVVTQANEAAHRLLPAIKEGAPLSYALRAPDVLDAVAAVIRDGEWRSVNYSERVPTERSFELNLGRIPKARGVEGAATGIVLFFRDLTAARRLEQLRADFVANASHELRTPLAALLGFVETLQGPARNDPAARERFLEIMRVQAERMRRLIDDLLSLSRVEMAAHLPPSSEVDLVALIRQGIDVLSPSAKERGVALELDLPSHPLMVIGDRDELLRLIENLFENAIKYGESGGRVQVVARRVDDTPAGGRVEFEVRDFGPGIAPEHLPRLTERFYRVDAALSRNKGGTGLGLAIVKHIVTHHRGRLLIESTPGEGATFKVLLPEGPSRADRAG